MKQGRPTIIYIAGYPRSGTTLLDRLLGASDEICGLGEAILAFDYIFSETGKCACQQSFSQCPVWAAVRAEFGNANRLILDQYESSRSRFETRLPPLLQAQGDSAVLKAYQSFTARFFDTIASAMPGKRAFVDSSKSGFDAIWRPLALHRLAGYEVRVIHLVRDARGVMASHLIRSNTKAEQGESGGTASPWFTGFHWLYLNWKVSLLRFLMPRGCYQAIAYEALISSPEETLGRIVGTLNFDAPRLPRRTAEGAICGGGHQVFGNRMRHAPVLELRQDPTWRTALSTSQALAGRALMAVWRAWTLALGI